MIQCKKNYGYDFYYDHGLIEYIVLVAQKKSFTTRYPLHVPKSIKNESYDFKQSIYNINVNEKMETKYYEYNVYYNDVLIKNIDPVESNIIYLPLCYLKWFQGIFNNESYGFKESKF